MKSNKALSTSAAGMRVPYSRMSGVHTAGGSVVTLPPPSRASIESKQSANRGSFADQRGAFSSRFETVTIHACGN
jgi:hypothetical protein